jgi:hypothetical protein
VPRQYWIDLFTGKTWDEFKAAGGYTSGFRESKTKTVRRLKPGDWLLCYVTGVSRFIAILEVDGEPFSDDTVIWSDDVFPTRIRVKLVAELTPEDSVPVSSILPRLSFHDELRPMAWTGHFRSSPSKVDTADGVAIADAIFAAQKSPTAIPIDATKWGRTPRGYESGDIVVTIPDDEVEVETAPTAPAGTDHDSIQSLLLRMGSKMGFDVWVARNDRGKVGCETPFLPSLTTPRIGQSSTLTSSG